MSGLVVRTFTRKLRKNMTINNMMIKKKSELMIRNSIEAFAIIKYHVIIIILKSFTHQWGES